MKKREFIKAGSILTVGAMVSPLTSCSSGGEGQGNNKAQTIASGFTLPDLPYAHAALMPYIDEQTMQIHHGKHHAGYVRKLNNALTDHAMNGKGLVEILSGINADDTGVRNNGGGHFNHSLFWQIMKPGGGLSPEGNLKDAMMSTFGSLETFMEEFGNAAATQFGSGWGWLSVDGDGKLFVSSTPNQDNPMMTNIIDRPGTPILGVDVWEHAYYLKYQNKRKEYLSNFMKIINWEQVAKNYASI